MSKFEYLVEVIRSGGDPEVDARLNELGNDGWDLVSVVNVGASLRFIFKREIEDAVGMK